MLNVNKPKGITIFLDIDGSMLLHNYDPDRIPETPLELRIISLAEFIKSQTGACSVIITTSRSESHAKLAALSLQKYGIYPNAILHSLPSGPRFLLNDSKSDLPTAFAICLPRDVDDRIMFS